MNTSLRWKIIFLVFTIIFSGIIIVPSFYKDTPEWWRKYLAPEGLRLGLDLQGGMHLVLKVNLEKAVENSLDLAAQDLKEGLAEKKITAVRTKSNNAQVVNLTLPNTKALSSTDPARQALFACAKKRGEQK